MFLEFTGAFFERLFGGGFGLFALAPDAADPLAELEVGQEKETDDVARGIDDCRASRAEHPEKVIIHRHADESAEAGSADGFAHAREPGILGSLAQMRQVQQMQPTHAGEQQDSGPGPAASQIGERLEPKSQAKGGQQDGQHVSGETENEKSGMAHVRAKRADPIMRGVVGRVAIGGEVAGIEGELRDEQKQSAGEQDDADDVVETAVRV